jgi:hypothetical protein
MPITESEITGGFEWALSISRVTVDRVRWMKEKDVSMKMRPTNRINVNLMRFAEMDSLCFKTYIGHLP